MAFMYVAVLQDSALPYVCVGMQGDSKRKVKDSDLSLCLYSKEKTQVVKNEG